MGLIRREKRDIFYKIAKALGYRSRSALKLLQIHESTDILLDIRRAVDLCASPGGFSKVLTEFVPPSEENHCPNVLGIDLQPIIPFDGAEFWKSLYEDILRYFGGNKVDIVVADGAPDSLGTAHEDAYYQTDLIFNSLILSSSILRNDGNFVVKVFRSKNIRYVMYVLNQFFNSILIAKPRVCRQSSCEAFAVCKGFKLPEFLRTFTVNEIYEQFWPYIQSLTTTIPSNFTFKFERCGNLLYDADANYPEVDEDFKKKFNIDQDKPLPVLQLPTMPAYKIACELKKSNNLAQIQNL